jgi:hypothetical protein
MVGAAGECASHDEGDGGCRDESHGLREMYHDYGVRVVAPVDSFASTISD